MIPAAPCTCCVLRIYYVSTSRARVRAVLTYVTHAYVAEVNWFRLRRHDVAIRSGHATKPRYLPSDAKSVCEPLSKTARGENSMYLVPVRQSVLQIRQNKTFFGYEGATRLLLILTINYFLIMFSSKNIQRTWSPHLYKLLGQCYATDDRMWTSHTEFQCDSTEIKEHDCDFIRLIRVAAMKILSAPYE